MGKGKKKQERPVPPVAAPAEEDRESGLAAEGGGSEPEAPAPEAAAERAPQGPAAAASVPARTASRLLRWAPDLIKVGFALAVIAVAAVIWYKPPLIRAGFPYVSYTFKGQRATDAALYRPLAMPTRYYIALPQKLAGRYEWFAVDRRREVAALTVAPPHRILGRKAVKRSDPLGLDLEFRKLDGSEWQIHFLDDAIVFSNALLTVRLDTKPSPDGLGAGKP